MYLNGPMRLGEPPQPQLQPYQPPFPNLQRQQPALYQQAMAIKAQLDKLASFKEPYRLLANATANAHLALDQADNIVIVPDETSTAELLGPKLVQAVLKATGKYALKQVLPHQFGTVLNVLDLFSKVITALGIPGRRDLVNNQRGSRFNDAHAYKLRFFIALYVARVAPTSNRIQTAYFLFDLFHKYRDLLGALWRFETMEKNLAAGIPMHTREPPRMYSR